MPSKMAKPEFSLVILLLLLLAGPAQSRFFTESHLDLVSDGIHYVHQPSSSSSSDTCDQTYGFLPCTTTVLGNLFLMLAYGYLMYLGATYLSTGCDLLLDILGPGIIGGLFLPILGALPDALLILVSGLSGSKETAQDQVSIGMGLLAGSTVMLLTLLWGSCIIVGKCDLSQNSTSLDSQDSKRCSLTGSGVTIDLSTSLAAKIMGISVIPFIIVQLTTVLKSASGKRIAILASLAVSIAFLFLYCLYQVFQPWIQERRLEYVRHKLVISGIIRDAQKRALGRLLKRDGKPDERVIQMMFQKIDQDSNGFITLSELRAVLRGIEFVGINLETNDIVKIVMDDFDTSGDVKISEDEFIKGLSKWLYVAKRSVPDPRPFSQKFLEDFVKMARREYDLQTEKSDNVEENVDDGPFTWFKAVTLLLLGTVIAAAFADPLVDAVDNFSSATSIPCFFTSFIAMPLATNSSEAVSAIIFASRKKLKTASLTFSEIYGAATMNNTLCLAVFLALVFFRNLTWDFSAEVLVILIVCIVMGLFTSFRTTFQLWTCSIAFLLYPLSLVLVYVLDYCFGWS